MRIALVHSYYSAKQPSGENITVDAQCAALRRAGHEVLIVSRHSDKEISSSLIKKVGVAYDVATGGGHDPSKELLAFSPDIVHVHNLFPNWGRSWLSTWETPIVATLHNFRAVCSVGTLYRDGHECRECFESGSQRAVVNRCYRGSSLASIPLAISTAGGAAKNLLVQRADALIVLSHRATLMHASVGLPEAKLRLVPNFVKSEAQGALGRGKKWIYVGRLSPEKGILELIESWPEDVGLDVVGAGPLAHDLRQIAPKSVEFHGMLEPEAIPGFLQKAAGLVFPSRLAEGAIPLSYVEAIANGRPVISWAGSGASDDIIQSGSGMVIDSWDELRATITVVESDWATYSAAARLRYENHYTEATWVTSMTKIYEELLERK